MGLYMVTIKIMLCMFVVVDKEGFVINHEILFKYNILTKSSSTRVLESINSYELEEHVDYVAVKLQVDDVRTQHIIYMITTDAFKIICIRSKIYYLLLKNVSSLTMIVNK